MLHQNLGGEQNKTNEVAQGRKYLYHGTMPTLSMFYGLIIRMYYAPKEHPPPHFHAYYGEFNASIGIETGEIHTGNLPQKQLRLVQAWAEIHREELLANWALVMNGEEPFKINPLN